MADESDRLPVSLSSLVGREAEIRAISSLIQRDDVRLASLTGPGGVGKTRLVLEIARRSTGAFADGIRFVDLSAVQDHRLVISAVMQALGVSSNSPSIETLLVALSRRPNMLLILDNFEQVIDAATEIAALIKGSADLTVLVTSRESLKIDGEREYPIAPLALPSASSHLALDQLSQMDAVRLFVERAQSVLPTFALTTENAAAIADVCSRLDGLPLAIELAAARVKVLPINTLLDRLDHRLPILVGVRRDTPERQQTMRNAIAWSYSLLTPQEQQLFRRLGVFVGGFTLAAAEAIGAVANLDDDVVFLLASLVDKSLVRLDQSAPTAPRYLMLDTIHEFAAEQLRASNENGAIRDAHANWCIQIGEERRLHGNNWTEPGWATPDIPQVTIEIANIRSALVWLADADNLAELGRLAGAVCWYWHEHGHRSEGLAWLRLSRQATFATPRDKQSRMWAMEGLSLHARNAGLFGEATEAAQACLALAVELGDVLGESNGLGFLGFIALGEGDYERAETLGQQAIAKRNETQEGWPISVALPLLAGAALGQGNLAAAREYFAQALDGQRDAGDLYDAANIQGWLALIDCEEGQLREAAVHLGEALPIWMNRNSQEALTEWLANVSVLARAAGQPVASSHFLAAGMALRDAVGHAYVLPERAIYERTEHLLRDDLGAEVLAHTFRDAVHVPLDTVLDDASAFLAQLLANPTATPTARATSPYGLTPRERDVLQLLVAGKSDREIAEALYIGSRTVQTHVSNLIAKLAVTNRTEAAACAVRVGLV